MKNPNGPSIEDIDDWNDAKRDAEVTWDGICRPSALTGFCSIHLQSLSKCKEIADWLNSQQSQGGAAERFDSRGMPTIINDLLLDETEPKSLVGVELANRRIRAVYQRTEAQHAKEVMLHAVTRFELKQARDLLQEFKHAANYLEAWIEHTIPSWGSEVQRGLEEVRAACDKVDALKMPSRQPQPDKGNK